ncbi:unnamed protein product, partial [Discosporangium mesarthrocarpum]
GVGVTIGSAFLRQATAGGSDRPEEYQHHCSQGMSPSSTPAPSFSLAGVHATQHAANAPNAHLRTRGVVAAPSAGPGGGGGRGEGAAVMATTVGFLAPAQVAAAPPCAAAHASPAADAGLDAGTDAGPAFGVGVGFRRSGVVLPG